jgi:DNA invertase Pin-like site-specific DNA recombinase
MTVERAEAIKRLDGLRMRRAEHKLEGQHISEQTGSVIRFARSSMTPTEIAEHAGVSRQTVHNILKENNG